MAVTVNDRASQATDGREGRPSAQPLYLGDHLQGPGESPGPDTVMFNAWRTEVPYGLS
jgi:hypothetical protein